MDPAVSYWKLLSEVNEPLGLNLSPTTVTSGDDAVNKIEPRPPAVEGNMVGRTNAV